MQLETGDSLKGEWVYIYERFKDPGNYTFYAEAQDTKGQKVRSEELSLVVQVR
ncbi:MAG: hypothetical protein HY400_07105 [Elusimicrobia bacterium]|nr:hypothetical protein [Elusimicrobiota bacterium]